MSKSVIKRSNLPTNLNLTFYGFIAFLMYYFQAPGYAWGIFGTLVVIILSAKIYRLAMEHEVDLLEDKKIGKIFSEMLRKKIEEKKQ